MIRFYDFQKMNNSLTNPLFIYQAYGWCNNQISLTFGLSKPLQFDVGFYMPLENTIVRPDQFLYENKKKERKQTQISLLDPIKSINVQIFEKQREKQTKVSSLVIMPISELLIKKQKTKYLKKNTESNISNQIFAFLSNIKKSQIFIFTLCKKENLNFKDQSLKFYESIKLIKASTKKYINKKFILNISIPSSNHLLIKQFQKLHISISENQLKIFCKIVRILTNIYLKQYGSLSIITSKKIHRQTVFEHLIRKRQIMCYLQNEYLKI